MMLLQPPEDVKRHCKALHGCLCSPRVRESHPQGLGPRAASSAQLPQKASPLKIGLRGSQESVVRSLKAEWSHSDILVGQDDAMRLVMVSICYGRLMKATLAIELWINRLLQQLTYMGRLSGLHKQRWKLKIIVQLWSVYDISFKFGRRISCH